MLSTRLSVLRPREERPFVVYVSFRGIADDPGEGDLFVVGDSLQSLVDVRRQAHGNAPGAAGLD